MRDLTGGYRAIRREVLEGVDLATLRSQGYVFNIEFGYRAQRAGFRVVEVPIVFRDRTVGESKISLSIAIEALWLVPSLRWPRLRRAWPARTVPLADPRLDPESPPVTIAASELALPAALEALTSAAGPVTADREAAGQ